MYLQPSPYIYPIWKLPRYRQIIQSLANAELHSHDAEDGAVIRNIEGCRAISQTVQTSLGPYGRNKIVINHLQKMILTSDAATILRELDVIHPAAKLLVMASQQQDSEVGDGTNMVIVLAGEMLKKAEELLRMGLKTSDITQGYEKAQNYALKVLEGTCGFLYPLFSGDSLLIRPLQSSRLIA